MKFLRALKLKKKSLDVSITIHPLLDGTSQATWVL
jgi:hypothetical protein